ncbi:MBL fold metallo-hydrolase [Chloroflexota bacterium]
MVDITEVAEHIYLIDDELYSIPKWGSVYLLNEEKKALIDTGPMTSAHAVVNGIKTVGLSPADIDYIIVTHIHLDHSGGVGFLIRDMPNAQVMVHQRGARHLVDPTRLMAGTIEAQGEGALKKNGEVVPIDTERVKSVCGGDVLRLSEGQLLEFIDAPGHAPHELCIYESRNNGAFTGDAAGLSLDENKILFPSTPLPSFNAEMCSNTIQGLMQRNLNRLYYAHFGVTTRVQESLKTVLDKLQVWDGMMAKVVKENKLDGAVDIMMAQVYADLELIKQKESLYAFLTTTELLVSVEGYIKYYREKHELS